jgi:hypothetical protein
MKPKPKPTKSAARRIAQLPKALRDEANTLLAAGLAPTKILEALADSGAKLELADLAEWRRTGHAAWLRERQWLEQMRSMSEFGVQAGRENEDSAAQQAGLQLAAAQLYELLSTFDPRSLRAKLKGDPAVYARLVTALAKLGDGELKFARYRAEVAECKARLQAGVAKAEGGGVPDEVLAEFKAELKKL